MTEVSQWMRTPWLLRAFGKATMRRMVFADWRIGGGFEVWEYRGRSGRAPPRNPPSRKYSFGVAWEFIEFMEERDETQRMFVRNYHAIVGLYKAFRREERWKDEFYSRG